MSAPGSHHSTGYDAQQPPFWVPAPTPPKPVVRRRWLWVALAVVGVLAGGAFLIHGLFGRPDGTQRYATLADLQAAMNEHGAHCEELVEDENPTFAAAQGRCSYGESELVLQLWVDGEHRGFGTDQVIAPLIGSEFGYCWVLGRGDNGAWSINVGVDRLLCRTLAEELGGELREQAPA